MRELGQHKNSVPVSNLTPNSIPKFDPKPSSQQLIEAKAKRSAQRPFSGGIQKIVKPDSGKARAAQVMSKQNFTMYDHNLAGAQVQREGGKILASSQNTTNT